jgi:hypothetical protein
VAFFVDVVRPEQKLGSLTDFLRVFSKTDLARMFVYKSLAIFSELFKSLWDAFSKAFHAEVQTN